MQGGAFSSFPVANVDPMQLTATIRTRPAEGAKNVDDLEMKVITTTATYYDDAYAELQQAVPEGWQMLSVRSH